jgi:hypothetical protein
LAAQNKEKRREVKDLEGITLDSSVPAHIKGIQCNVKNCVYNDMSEGEKFSEFLMSMLERVEKNKQKQAEE